VEKSSKNAPTNLLLFCRKIPKQKSLTMKVFTVGLEQKPPLEEGEKKSGQFNFD